MFYKAKDIIHRKNILFLSLFLMIILCFPLEIKSAHITYNSSNKTYSTKTDFTCSPTKSRIGNLPCIVRVYRNYEVGDTGIPSNGSRSSTLKYINLNNKQKVVFCVEHHKQNPEVGAQCLLKYQNYSHYVLAGLGEIIRKSGGDNLTISNIINNSNYQAGYVNVALAQNDYLQALKYYQGGGNGKVGGNETVTKLANMGIVAAFNYFYYSKNLSNLATLSLNFDRNKSLNINLNRKTLKIERLGQEVAKGKISFDSCSYTIWKNNDRQGIVSGSCGSNQDLNITKDLRNYNFNDNDKINVKITLSKDFYLAALYDCVGQDVTLANSYKITKTLTIQKSLTVRNNKTFLIRKTDNYGRKVSGATFTVSTKMPETGNDLGTFNRCTTKSNGECTITLASDATNYYVFEAYKYNGCSSKSVANGGTNDIYYNVNPNNYDLSSPTYIINGHTKTVSLEKRYISAYYSYGGCEGKDTIKNSGYIKRVPYILFKSENDGNNVINVTNKVIEAGCSSELQSIMKNEKNIVTRGKMLEALYQKYLQSGNDYRQLLNFSNPQCERINLTEKQSKVNCLSYSETYSDDFFDTNDDLGNRKFKKFTSNDLSTYEEQIPTGLSQRYKDKTYPVSAYCKSVYEVSPTFNIEDLKPVYGGELYFKLNDSKIMSGEFTKICYVIGNYSNIQITSTLPERFSSSATLISNNNRINLSENELKREETLENYLVRNDEPSGRGAPLSAKYLFRKFIYVAKVEYDIPQVLINLNGKIMTEDECEKNQVACRSLGYGILSPISTNSDSSSSYIIVENNNTDINNNNGDSWMNDINTFDSDKNSIEGSDQTENEEDEYIDSGSDLEYNVASDVDGVANAGEIETSDVDIIEMEASGEDDSFTGNETDKIYYFNANKISSEEYKFEFGNKEAVCNFSYIPQALCNGKLCVEFRIIDTKNPFITKKGQTRKTMSNWCYDKSKNLQQLINKNLVYENNGEYYYSETNEKIDLSESSCSYNNILVRENIYNAPNSYGIKNTEGNQNKVQPKYKITLNKESIEYIKNTASNMGITYDNFKFDCSGDKCESKLLKNLKDNTNWFTVNEN